MLLDQLKNGASARLVLIAIDGAPAKADVNANVNGDAGGAPATRADTSRRFAAALRASGLFASVENGEHAAWADAGKFVFEHRYLLSPAVDAARFSVTGLRAAIDETVALLGTPAGSLLKPILFRDPTGETVRIAEALTPARAPRNENGVWVARTTPRALLLATTRADGADLDGQQRALAAIRSTFDAVAAPGLRLRVSGAGRFAVESRERIKAEVERLALLGSVVIVVLLLLAFASLRALLVALVPVATGVVAGIAAVSLAFDQVHGMTLGFGTTLIGEAVDYAIYFLVQARGGPGSSERWRRESWPTVRLGLFTSLIGFAALLFTGFPGLGAARRVLDRRPRRCGGDDALRLPGDRAERRAGRRLSPPARPLHGRGRSAAAARPRRRGPARGAGGRRARHRPLALARRAGVAQPGSGRRSRARRRPARRPRRRRRRERWSPSRRRASKARWRPPRTSATRLDKLVSAAPCKATTRRRGSCRASRRRRDGATRFPTARRLRSRARSRRPSTDRCPRRGWRPSSPTSRPREASRRSNAATWTAARSASPSMPCASRATRPGPGARSSICSRATARPLDAEAIRHAVADVPGARVVAIKAELDAIYARFLGAAEWQAALGALAVLGLLALRLRRFSRLVAVALPIAAATLIVLAALALTGVALGILHLVGLLLTVAIGSNYALFFDHLGTQGAVDEDTLASLLLANLTTVASFALLATLAHSGAPGGRHRGRARSIALPGLSRPAWLGRREPAAGTHGKIAA